VIFQSQRLKPIGRFHGSAPEVPEPRRAQLSIAHRVLDVLVPYPGLDRPRIVPRVRQGVAAANRPECGR
jgi:hypothetical protein